MQTRVVGQFFKSNIGLGVARAHVGEQHVAGVMLDVMCQCIEILLRQVANFEFELTLARHDVKRGAAAYIADVECRMWYRVGIVELLLPERERSSRV